MVARTGEGLQTLLSTIDGVMKGEILTQPRQVHGTPDFQKAVNELVPYIQQVAPEVPNPRWLAIRLLDGDMRIQQACRLLFHAQHCSAPC